MAASILSNSAGTVAPFVLGHSEKVYRIEGGKRFMCGNKACYKKYSVTVGTFFENSNIDLRTWFAVMYLITTHKK